jgi:hypothetical protein
LTLAAPLMRYVDFVTTHAAHAYVEFQQFAVADADRERRDLLEQLLTGEWPAQAELRAAGEKYAISATSLLVVIVAVTRPGDGDAPHTVSGALSRLARLLVVARRDEIVAVAALASRDSARELAARIVETHERLAAEGIEFAAAVSTVADGVAQLPHAYAEARALWSIRRSAKRWRRTASAAARWL